MSNALMRVEPNSMPSAVLVSLLVLLMFIPPIHLLDIAKWIHGKL